MKRQIKFTAVLFIMLFILPVLSKVDAFDNRGNGTIDSTFQSITPAKDSTYPYERAQFRANDKQRANVPSIKDISEFITPDGRFNDKSAKSAGYQGALNMKGYDIAFDSASGQPVFISSGLCQAADNPDDIYWSGISNLQGIDGLVAALAIYEGLLIAAGEFKVAGSVIACNIASWDGSTWTPLGSGTKGWVADLVIYDDRLIAGGFFTEAGDVAANCVAAWDGFNWSPLDLGLTADPFTQAQVQALTVYDNKLVAGGRFSIAGGIPANNIAAWNGSTWSPLGSGISGRYYPVEALISYNNRLIVGGEFDSAGGITANNIAAWDGSSWDTLGSGISGIVGALTDYSNLLIAGGNFDTVGSNIEANCLAKWDGSSWLPIELPGEFSSVYNIKDLAVYNNRLIVGGDFTFYIGYERTENIAAWNGSSWSRLGSGLYGRFVWALTVFGNRLIAGGLFTEAGSKGTSNIASWSGYSWSPLGLGLNGSILAFTEYNNKLITGGSFTTAGGITRKYIAAWDGSYWFSLGSGMNGSVNALAIYHDKLVAGGWFTKAGGIVVNNIANWDGSSWSPLGSGIGGYSSTIKALIVYDSKLIAAGTFVTIGGIEANNIAAWDGSSWSPLGSGISGGIFYSDVTSLTVYNDLLIAGGSFTAAGDIEANNIAAWNGTTWSPLESGIGEWSDDHIKALIVYDEKLIAGGEFNLAGGIEVNNIAAWDGYSWYTLGLGISDYVAIVEALTVYNGILITGGFFSKAGEIFAKRIAAWNGSSWSSLGSGVDGGVFPCSVSALFVNNDKLMVGGGFAIAGDKVSAYIAQWSKHICGDANSDGRINVSDAVYLINCVFRGGPCPEPDRGGDSNCDGKVNISDAVYLINNVFRGGPGPCAGCE
ncbi:MAG: dockerin type I repeat-containing protein [Candidatus Zixiibacteriota bacterium]